MSVGVGAMSSGTAKSELRRILAVLIVAIVSVGCATNSNTRFQAITNQSAAKLQAGNTSEAWSELEKLSAEQASLSGSRGTKRSLLAAAIKVHLDLASRIESQGDLGTARTILLRAVELECLDDEWSSQGGPATASYKAVLKNKSEVVKERQVEKTESITTDIKSEISAAKRVAASGDSKAAETLLLNSAQRSLKQYGNLSASYLKVRDALADMYRLESKPDKARKIHTENIKSLEAMSERYEGTDKEQLWAEALNKELLALAAIEESGGRFSEEEKILRKAETLCAHIFGKETLHYADVEIALSSPLARTGRANVASDLLNDALALYESNNRSNRAKICEIISKQAIILAREKRYQLALDCCNRAIGILDKHPNIGNRGIVVGVSIECLLWLGRDEDAIGRTAEFVSLCKKGSGDPSTSFARLSLLGDLWFSKKNYLQARRMYGPALTNFEALSSTLEQRRRALLCCLNLAECNFELKRLADTIASANKASQLLSVNKDASLKLAGIYNGIAGLLGHDGKFEAAIAWQAKALKLCETRVGVYESPTISTLIQMSDSYRRAGDMAKTNELLRTALGRCGKNPSDPDVKNFKDIVIERLK
ncbi:MAG: tetratricopeptide repeat protein [Candidatus Obscuribacterales bacterium]|nr:tetratricopeptide repeat protein [Candidatus Obscuribacterales bacterium]